MIDMAILTRATPGVNASNTTGNHPSTHGNPGRFESGSIGVGTLISVSCTSIPGTPRASPVKYLCHKSHREGPKKGIANWVNTGNSACSGSLAGP